MTTEERLTKLERSLRRWKLGAILGVGLAAGMGAMAKAPDIRCRSVSVVDDQDRVRIRLSVSDNGLAVVSVQSENKDARPLMLAVRADGQTAITLRRPGDLQDAAVRIGADDEFGGSIHLHNLKGHVNILDGD
jgi:hypothetical protein